MRSWLVALVLLIPLPLWAADLPDTPENRTTLAKQLVALQAPDMRRSVDEMTEGFAQMMPEAQRADFRSYFSRVYHIEEAFQYTELVMAKDLTTAELAALIDFYQTPAGRSVMTKMPQVMKDTLPLLQAAMIRALKQLPPDKRPAQFRNL